MDGAVLAREHFFFQTSCSLKFDVKMFNVSCRSRLYRLFSLQRHVLDSLGWERPPDIDAETKRRLLGGMGTPLYVSRQKTCYYSACKYISEQTE